MSGRPLTWAEMSAGRKRERNGWIVHLESGMPTGELKEQRPCLGGRGGHRMQRPVGQRPPLGAHEQAL